MVDDVLTELCIRYSHDIDNLKFSLMIMTGLMIFWLIVAMVEFSIIRVYQKGEKYDG